MPNFNNSHHPPMVQKAVEELKQVKIEEDFQVFDVRESKKIVSGKMILMEMGTNFVYLHLENGYRVVLTANLIKKLLSQEVMDRLTE